jgi:hypothetical protein
MVSLADARRVIAASEKKAAEIGVRNATKCSTAVQRLIRCKSKYEKGLEQNPLHSAKR